MHAFVAVLDTSLEKIFDQIRRHMQRVIKISDRFHLSMCQRFPEILFRDEQQRLDLFLRPERIDLNSLGGCFRTLLDFWSRLALHFCFLWRSGRRFAGAGALLQFKSCDLAVCIPFDAEEPCFLPVTEST